MLSYLAYTMRFTQESDQMYGETLVSSALRILQDCPTNGVALRRVSLQLSPTGSSNCHCRSLLLCGDIFSPPLTAVP